VAVDEWRVEVDLGEEEHHYPLAERIRSVQLDDKARERLGPQVIVTRDGPRLFLYAATEASAREAEQVVRELIETGGLTASVSVTRWHPVEEAWKDVSIPLPRTEADVEAERARREEAERREAAMEHSYDWHVKAELPSRHDAVELEQQLAAEGLPVRRRWRYLTIGVLTEERANDLGAALQERAPPGTEIWVEVNRDDLPHSVFGFIPPLG
jgi:hypothetical protein